MYLDHLSIEGYKNFRDALDIPLSKGLNVLVGENGVGKSAIIDAIRLLLLEDEFGRNLVSENDFHRSFGNAQQSAESFYIRGEFRGLGEEEAVALLPWLEADGGASVSCLVRNRKGAQGRLAVEHWGGASRASAFEKELFDSIHCIYLPPLRDAEAKLREGRGSRLARLLRRLNQKQLSEAKTTGTLTDLESKVRDFNKSLPDDQSISYANQQIQDRLVEAVGEVFGQGTRIQYSESNFSRIVENLRLFFYPNLTSQAGPEEFRSLDQNSLGYNNLLYLATVLAELEDEGPENPSLLRLLLIEEPEAHLHPQLQVKLLKYLEQKASEGKVQVIVTTHSSVLASSASLDSLIHVCPSDGCPTVTALGKCGITDESKDFVSRWLDVTKSTLLFAKGIILVEGIAEAMILPLLARRVLSEFAERSTSKRLPRSLEEAGVTIINMNGIFFRHFMQLFCDVSGKDATRRIPVRCAGITDNDPDTASMPTTEGECQGRNSAIKLVSSINKSEFVRLFVSGLKTFEYDLAMERGNLGLMLEVLKSANTLSGSALKKTEEYLQVQWEHETDLKQKAEASYFLLENVKRWKGEYAQALAADMLKFKYCLDVPAYFRNALLWACGGDLNDN